MYSIHHIPLYSYSGLISKFISYHLMPSHVIYAPIDYVFTDYVYHRGAFMYASAHKHDIYICSIIYIYIYIFTYMHIFTYIDMHTFLSTHLAQVTL